MGDWGPFEIILVLVLVAGIFSAIGRAPTIAPTSQNQTQQVGLSDAEKRCGLSLTSPLARARVTDGVRVSGSVNGCKWNPVGEIALYAQIIDAKGAPLSDLTTIPPVAPAVVNTPFDMTVPLSSIPKTDTGTLILIPAEQRDDAITVRVPLRFVR